MTMLKIILQQRLITLKLNTARTFQKKKKKSLIKLRNIEKDELTNKKFKLITSAYSVNDTLRAIEISKAYEVEFELTVKGKDDDDENDVSLVLIKENGDWKDPQ